MAKDSSRMSAEERRERVIEAAIIEFARGGYATTSTAAIARRVGVSQPYLFRLFPDKRAIFLAAARRCTDEIRERFAQVSAGLPPGAAHDAMAAAYTEFTADPDRLLFQMQMYVAAATAEREGVAERPVTYRVDVLGGTVEVELTGGDGVDQAFLTGPAVIVGHGEFTGPED
jgi:AcrR family transcriptional regulator